MLPVYSYLDYQLQNRFLRNGKTNKDTLWHVPISYTSKSDVNFEDTKPKIWLAEEQETSFTIEGDGWYLLNLQQTGK